MDKELEQKIIVVSSFIGRIDSRLDIYDLPEDWRLIHSAWDKFRDMLGQLVIGDLGTWRTYCNHRAKIKNIITTGTPLEAFNALHDGIVWFNELKKEG